MDRNEHPIVLACTYDILVMTIVVSKNVTGEGVVCGINFLQWGIISLDLHGIDRNCLADPPMNLLNILLISSC